MNKSDLLEKLGKVMISEEVLDRSHKKMRREMPSPKEINALGRKKTIVHRVCLVGDQEETTTANKVYRNAGILIRTLIQEWPNDNVPEPLAKQMMEFFVAMDRERVILNIALGNKIGKD
ncbi:MAG: hypothetical protein BWY51_00651 [Parcubacteria group bacterium ADurb.Bin316]|nr:MAG: hypothetical protein BWY51_00651 [Parcubacteria group bacterium ADurb.Bin316]HOZ56129.1 hypothetical protein [bacterium]